jgi:hypothetical protein
MSDPNELLSAYLDDELDPAERAEVAAYLADSADGRDRLEGLAEIRTALRQLPTLDPPRPLVAPSAPTAARARRVVPVLVAAVVVLLGGFLLLSRAGDDPTQVMDTGQLLALHQDAQRMMADDTGEAPGDLVVVSDTSDVAHMPDDLGAGMQRMGIYGTDELVQLVYSDGTHVVSVFEQPHDSAAPMEGESMEVGGRDAMHQSMDGSEVLMLAEGDMVVTVVGEGELDSLSAMAGLVVSA